MIVLPQVLIRGSLEQEIVSLFADLERASAGVYRTLEIVPEGEVGVHRDQDPPEPSLIAELLGVPFGFDHRSVGAFHIVDDVRRVPKVDP